SSNVNLRIHSNCKLHSNIKEL
ncbi:hypothetical protein GJ496_009440, partial [Pomphorhynchus laevis]